MASRLQRSKRRSVLALRPYGIATWNRQAGGAELASGEGREGAQAAVEFGVSQTALAIEPAEEILGGSVAFVAIAFEADRDQVAIGVAAGLRAGHDVVEAAHGDGESAQAVKAKSALAQMNGLAQSLGLHEVDLLEAGRVRESRKFGGVGRIEAGDADFIGQTDFDNVAGLGACEQSKDATVNQAADRQPYRVGGDASGAA